MITEDARRHRHVIDEDELCEVVAVLTYERLRTVIIAAFVIYLAGAEPLGVWHIQCIGKTIDNWAYWRHYYCTHLKSVDTASLMIYT